MPRKNVDDLKTLAEVLEVFEILNEKYDEDLNKTQLKELLRKILEHQSSGSGHYSTGISVNSYSLYVKIMEIFLNMIKLQNTED